MGESALVAIEEARKSVREEEGNEGALESREGTPFIAVGRVSVLAPVFFCYGLQGLEHEHEVLPRERPPEVAEGSALIERAIQELFNYEPFSPEEALVVVPDVESEHCPRGYV